MDFTVLGGLEEYTGVRDFSLVKVPFHFRHVIVQQAPWMTTNEFQLANKICFDTKITIGMHLLPLLQKKGEFKMSNSLDKRYTSPPKLYQYPIWELPASNVILSHSLLALSDCKELIKQNESSIPHMVGLSRPEANYVSLDESFIQLLIAENYRLCGYYSLENVKKREEEERIREEKFEKAKALNDFETIEAIKYEDILLQSKHIEMELDKPNSGQRTLELNKDLTKLFVNFNELQHGDIIQFRNERRQFSFYVYKAKYGTFKHLLIKFKEYVQKISEQRGVITEHDQSIDNFSLLDTNK
ncbi:unnamed protein product [Rotaria socialis]